MIIHRISRNVRSGRHNSTASARLPLGSRANSPRNRVGCPWRRIGATIAAGFMALLLLAVSPTIAHADAPGTRGDPTLPQGAAPAHTDASAYDQAWQDVQTLPPPEALYVASPAFVRPSARVAANESWLGRSLNPGNWMLDAGMGVIAGTIATTGETAERAARVFLGGGGDSWTIIPRSCGDNMTTNFVFCTPPELTYAHPNLAPVWNVMRAAAQGMVTVLFLVRMGRLLTEGAVSLATEGKRLVLTFLGVSLFVNSTAQTLGFVIDLFNALTNALLARAQFDIPTPVVAELIIGDWAMYLTFWVFALLLMFKGFFRLVNIIVLLGVAPIAGALLMDHATAPRFYGWLNRLIDSLVEQLALTIAIIVSFGLLRPFQAGLMDAFVNYLLGSAVLVMTLFGTPQLMGIARAATQNNYLVSRLKHSALRSSGKLVDAGINHVASLAEGARGAIGGRGFDNAFRQTVRNSVLADSARSNGRSAAAPRAHGQATFHLPAQASPTLRRYRALAAQTPASAPMEGPAREHRRQRAAIHARGMRIQADAIRHALPLTAPAGERPALKRQAGELYRRADLQQAFARGELAPRPSRWTDEQKQRRREIARAALLETQSAHMLEREAALAAIANDRREIRAADPGARPALMARIRDRQDRARELTPVAGETIAAATRRQAADVARQQWAAEGLAMPRPAQPAALWPALAGERSRRYD